LVRRKCVNSSLHASVARKTFEDCVELYCKAIVNIVGLQRALININGELLHQANISLWSEN